MKILYFHIGLPKTGTTYLQHILEEDSRINLTRSQIHKFHNNDSLTYIKNKVNVDSNETYLLRGEGAKKYNMMLSLSKIKDSFKNIKIIITLREPYSALLSMFKYRIQNGKHFKNFDDWFISDEAQDFFSILHFSTLHKSLNTFFEDSDINYLFYEDLESGKMIKEFYNILGLNEPNIKPAKKLNKAHSNLVAQKINVLNKYIPQKRIRSKIKNYIPDRLFALNNAFFESEYKTKIIAELNEEMKKFYEICDQRSKLKIEEHNYLF